VWYDVLPRYMRLAVDEDADEAVVDKYLWWKKYPEFSKKCFWSMLWCKYKKKALSNKEEYKIDVFRDNRYEILFSNSSSEITRNIHTCLNAVKRSAFDSFDYTNSVGFFLTVAFMNESITDLVPILEIMIGIFHPLEKKLLDILISVIKKTCDLPIETRIANNWFTTIEQMCSYIWKEPILQKEQWSRWINVSNSVWNDSCTSPEQRWRWLMRWDKKIHIKTDPDRWEQWVKSLDFYEDRPSVGWRLFLLEVKESSFQQTGAVAIDQFLKIAIERGWYECNLLSLMKELPPVQILRQYFIKAQSEGLRKEVYEYSGAIGIEWCHLVCMKQYCINMEERFDWDMMLPNMIKNSFSLAFLKDVSNNPTAFNWFSVSYKALRTNALKLSMLVFFTELPLLQKHRRLISKHVWETVIGHEREYAPDFLETWIRHPWSKIGFSISWFIQWENSGLNHLARLAKKRYFLYDTPVCPPPKHDEFALNELKVECNLLKLECNLGEYRSKWIISTFPQTKSVSPVNPLPQIDYRYNLLPQAIRMYNSAPLEEVKKTRFYWSHYCFHNDTIELFKDLRSRLNFVENDLGYVVEKAVEYKRIKCLGHLNRLISDENVAYHMEFELSPQKNEGPCPIRVFSTTVEHQWDSYLFLFQTQYS
jgi:hypothetical protein